MRDVMTDKDYKEGITLVVRRKDGTILVYGDTGEPVVILPPAPAPQEEEDLNAPAQDDASKGRG